MALNLKSHFSHVDFTGCTDAGREGRWGLENLTITVPLTYLGRFLEGLYYYGPKNIQKNLDKSAKKSLIFLGPGPSPVRVRKIITIFSRGPLKKPS